MDTVTFNCGGEKLTVNPNQVATVQPYESSPHKTVLTVFGHKYKIRGAYDLVKAALGWEDGPIVGFDTPKSKEWEAMLLRHAQIPEPSPLEPDIIPEGESEPIAVKKPLTGREAMGEPVTVTVEADGKASEPKGDDPLLDDLPT